MDGKGFSIILQANAQGFIQIPIKAMTVVGGTKTVSDFTSTFAGNFAGGTAQIHVEGDHLSLSNQGETVLIPLNWRSRISRFLNSGKHLEIVTAAGPQGRPAFIVTRKPR